MMKVKYTEDVQEALQQAQRLMFQKQQQQLDAEHIFLALLVMHDKAVAKIIDKLGGDRQDMAHRIDKALSNPQAFGFVQGSAAQYLTRRAIRVLQGAAEEAARLEDEDICTEHMLLAIANEPSGTVARVLHDAGITHDQVLEALLEIRNAEPPAVERPRGAAALTEEQPEYEKQIVKPATLVKPVGFSHGIVTKGGRLLFLAGQTALDRGGKVVSPGDIVGQYYQVLSNLQMVVEAAGGEMEDIVKMTIFVKDRDDYRAHLKELGNVHKVFFGSYYPAVALLEISRFFDDEAMIEIDGIAVVPEGEEADS